MSFFPLKKLIKNKEPDFLIIHLITSLPLLLLILFNFKTKFILRISGNPRMNFFRRFLWKLASKKIFLITCPTKNTKDYIESLNIIDIKKIKILYDPIIELKKIINQKKQSLNLKDYFFSAGRLTKQKNFLFLCEAFKKIIEKDKNIKLLIAGDGEEKVKIENYIIQNNLKDNIKLIGYVKNIYPYFKQSKGFILSSLWEDPGFVLIEASICRVGVLSSNVGPGPVELIKDSHNGLLYESNNLGDFEKKFNIFKNYKDLRYLKLNNLLKAKKFTVFNHYRNFNLIISQ